MTMNAPLPKQSLPPPSRPAPVRITSPDFRARLTLTTAADTAKGMFFNGVLDAVQKLLDATARERCLQSSGEKKFIDFFNYPIATFLPMVFTAAELLATSLNGHDAAFRKLGKQATTDFLTSGVGKTLLILAGHEPSRLLSAVPTAFRTAVSYGERRVDLLGPQRAVVKMTRDFMPHPYHEGVLAGALEQMHARNVKVVGRRLGPLDADYEVNWEPLNDKGGTA